MAYVRYFDDRDTCFDCKWANSRVYESGQVDDVEYRCTLQNNKLIYDDLHCDPDYSYSDLPDCPIGLFEVMDSE